MPVPDTGPRGVVEIRVHGVGGTPPEDLLGETTPPGLIRVAGEGKSAFFARRNQETEGYAWGPLTSGALAQPLWILLLPFTLVNVGGWMLPARPEDRDGGWKLARVIVVLLGLTLTVGYVFGIAVIVIRQLFYQWRINGWIAEPSWRLMGGALVMLGLIQLAVATARSRQKQYEAVSSEDVLLKEAGDASAGPPRTSYESSSRVFGSLLDEQTGFGDATFWKRDAAASSFLRLHNLVAVAALIVLVVRAWSPATGPEQNFGWSVLFAGLGLVQIVLLSALVLVSIFGFEDWRTHFVRKGFRWFGPAVASVTAIALSSGFFAGLAIAVGRTLNGLSTEVRSFTVEGPELNLNLAFGAGTITFILATLALALRLFRNAKKDNSEIPINEKGPGHPLDGVPESLVSKVRRSRSFSEAGANIDLLLSWPAVVFVPIALYTLLDVLDRGDAVLPLSIPDIESFVFFTAGSFDVTVATLVSSVGGWIAATLTVLLLTFLVRNYFKPGQRRKIGILWDVLTFWPRRFHPLAVRPYAERAVPELEDRLYFHHETGRRIILSTHSQGTILGFAALTQIANSNRSITDQIAFVTYGSPLSQLHGRFFRGYFTPLKFQRLRESLFRGSIRLADVDEEEANRKLAKCWQSRSDEDLSTSWLNVYRETDYIGKRIHLPSGCNKDEDSFNLIVDDPPQETLVADSGFGSLFEDAPDASRPPWVGLSLHSYYNSELALKNWIAALREVMARP